MVLPISNADPRKSRWVSSAGKYHQGNSCTEKAPGSGFLTKTSVSGPKLSLQGIFPASGLEVVQAALLTGLRDCSRRCQWPRDLPL